VSLTQGRALLYADDSHHLARFRYTDLMNVINLGRELARHSRPFPRSQADPVSNQKAATPASLFVNQAVRPTAMAPSSPSEPKEAEPSAAVTKVSEPRVLETKAAEKVEAASKPDEPQKPRGPVAPGQARATASSREVVETEPQLRPSLVEQAAVFRILGIFVQSGIPLLHGLNGLAVQGETPRIRALASRVHEHLLRGNRLSESLARFARFDPLAIPLLRAAESSGRLNHVFKMLATHLEEKRDRINKVRTALVYPAFVLGAGVTMALTVPPLVLRDQLRSYGTKGLPLPTRLLLFMSSPWFWIVLALAAAALWRASKIPGWQRKVPGARRIYSAGVEVSLATSLALQLEAGVGLLTAVETAIQTCQLPTGPQLTPRVLEALKDGKPLSVALRSVDSLRRPFLYVLAAGEEVGKLVETLKWNSRLAKIEYDQSLDAAVRLMEPVVMMVLGVIVAIIALGSLLPTMRLLQQ
jgi:type II secretory pathway component PulF